MDQQQTAFPTGALFVVTYVDFLAEILEQNPDEGLAELTNYGAATKTATADNTVPMIRNLRLSLNLTPNASRRKKSAISLTITAIFPSSMLTLIPLRER